VAVVQYTFTNKHRTTQNEQFIGQKQNKIEQIFWKCIKIQAFGKGREKSNSVHGKSKEYMKLRK
jgi:hypothetical protein